MPTTAEQIAAEHGVFAPARQLGSGEREAVWDMVFAILANTTMVLISVEHAHLRLRKQVFVDDLPAVYRVEPHHVDAVDGDYQ